MHNLIACSQPERCGTATGGSFSAYDILKLNGNE
jgi:hypothetical protein